MTILQKRINESVDKYVTSCIGFKKFGMTQEVFYKRATSQKFLDKYVLDEEDKEITKAALSLLHIEVVELYDVAQRKKKIDKNIVDYLKDILSYVKHCDELDAEGKQKYMLKILKWRKRMCANK